MNKVCNSKAIEDVEPGSKPEVGIVQKHDDDFEEYKHCVLVLSDPEEEPVSILQHHPDLQQEPGEAQHRQDAVTDREPLASGPLNPMIGCDEPIPNDASNAPYSRDYQYEDEFKPGRISIVASMFTVAILFGSDLQCQGLVPSLQSSGPHSVLLLCFPPVNGYFQFFFICLPHDYWLEA